MTLSVKALKISGIFYVDCDFSTAQKFEIFYDPDEYKNIDDPKDDLIRSIWNSYGPCINMSDIYIATSKKEKVTLRFDIDISRKGSVYAY